MKICFVCEGYQIYRGGIESFTNSIARCLIKNGHEVHIITLANEDRYLSSDEFVEDLHIHKIYLKKSPFVGFWKLNKALPLSELYFSIKVTKKINELVKKSSIDVVESSILNFWYFWKKVPFVIRLHGYAGFEKRYISNSGLIRKIRKRIQWLIERSVLKNASQLIAVSLDHAKAVKEVWKFKDIVNNAIIIHNGVNTNIFFSEKGDMCKELNIVFVGRIKKEKGVEVIVDAIPSASTKYPNIRFIFIGKDSDDLNGGSYIEFLKRKAGESRAIFLGALPHEEIINYYRKSSICVFPSLFREPFPLVALEAMACGCVVVASNYGGFKEIIDNNVDGILIPPGDSRELANSIIRILEDSSIAAKMGKNAEKKIQERFNVDIMTQRTIEVYKRIITQVR